VKFVYQDIDGNLDINKIFNEHGITSTFFISGPPIMIRTFRKYLLEKQVLDRQIITDDWE